MCRKEGKLPDTKVISLGVVKCRVGIKSNKKADNRAKEAADKADPAIPVIMEVGLKEGCKNIRKIERCVIGTREGRVLRWIRKASMSYVHCRTNKGNLQSCRYKLGSIVDSFCRSCGKHMETSKHVDLVCLYREDIGRRWSSWE